jgi:hypothetical protein
MRTRWKTALAAAALAAGPLALAAATPALATVEPSVNYSETGGSGAGATTTHITIDSNPSNVEVRAWELCTNGVTLVGGWHNAVGATSNTASCSPYIVFYAGFDYRKSSPIQVKCYTEGNSRTGFC